MTAAWRRALVACGLLTVLLAGLFWSTLEDMVAIWVNSETYSHSFLILPISLWLAWRRRDQLQAVAPQPAPWVLLLSLGAALVWGLALLLSIQVGEQLALVTVWVTGLWALLGHRVARLLAFPLLFLFLMVPMGDGLVPPMMDFTAEFTVRMLELTGIPVYREGLNFVIPSGNWSVVEACSGVRYLIASVTLGLLYAYLTYRSLWRRAVFVVLSALVPILANGLRAYMIVMIGHLSNMELAVGVDHLIYGWIFFGLVMLLLFWLGGLWAEDEPARVAVQTPAPTNPGSTGTGALAGVLAGMVLVSLAAHGGVAALRGDGAQQHAIGLPDTVAGWQLRDKAALQWPARIQRPDKVVHVGYVKDGVEVDVVLGIFQRQQQGAEAVSSRNAVLEHGTEGWRRTGHGYLALTVGGTQLKVPVHHLAQQRTYLLGEAKQRLLVADWYRLGSYNTTNEYLGKWYQALALLADGRSDGAYVMLATRDGDQAPGRLEAFARDALPAVLGALDAAETR